MLKTIKRLRSKSQKNRKVLSPNKFFQNRKLNAQKFKEFVTDKPHRIIERKQKICIPLGVDVFLPFFLGNEPKQMLENVYKVSSIIGDYYFIELEITIREELNFEVGIYQDFYKYYQNNLSKSEDFAPSRDFALFVISFLNPIESVKDEFDKSLNKLKQHNGGRKLDSETKLILKLKKEQPQITAKKLAKMLAEDELSRLKEKYIGNGLSQVEANQKAKEKINADWIEDKNKNIANRIQYHKSNQRKSNNAEKYFSDTENYLSVFRTSNHLYIISSDSK